MTDELKNILKERLNLRLILSAVFLSVLGTILIYISSTDLLLAYHTIKAFTGNLGSLILVTGLLSLAWEIAGKRAFVDELFTIFSISKASVEAGVIDYSKSFQDHKIDWNNLFINAKQIDLLFWGSSTWRHHHFDRIDDFVSKKESKITVILPDLKDPNTVQSIGYQMKKSNTAVIKYINDAIEYFIKLNKKYPNSQIAVWLIKQPSRFSVFRFDNKAILSLYSHRRDYVSVPTWLCSKGGNLFDFIEQEIDSITGRGTESPLGEKVYTS